MIYTVKVGELLECDFSSYMFVTFEGDDVRTTEYIEKGSVVVSLGKKIHNKFVRVASGKNVGWIHVASVRKIK